MDFSEEDVLLLLSGAWVTTSLGLLWCPSKTLASGTAAVVISLSIQPGPWLRLPSREVTLDFSLPLLGLLLAWFHLAVLPLSLSQLPSRCALPSSALPCTLVLAWLSPQLGHSPC
jgi:hypothetical protein